MNSLKLNIAIFTTLIFWSSAFIGIRLGLMDYSPGALALLRFLVASLCMIIIYPRLVHPKKIPGKVKIQLSCIGVAAIGIYNICLNIGELTVSAGVASFVIGLIPIFTIILSILFLKERPSLVVWVGIVISFIGLSVMIKGETQVFSLNGGVLIILISALAGAGYNISQKRYLQIYHPIAITAWVIWGGTLVLLGFAPALWLEVITASKRATWAAVYMGIFPAALAYITWSYVLNQLPAWKASTYLYFLPVLSTLMGLLLLHEHPSALSLQGGLLALIGAFIATKARNT